MWDEMPEVLRLRALLLVYDTDNFIQTYYLPGEFAITYDRWHVSFYFQPVQCATG